MKTLSIELEEGNELSFEETKKLNGVIFEEIIQNLPAEKSTSNIFITFSQASGTLQFEFDQLLNLQ